MSTVKFLIVHNVAPTLYLNTAIPAPKGAFGGEITFNIHFNIRRIFFEKDPLSTFKRKLDLVLNTVPDEPTIPGLTRNAKSNSLVHQMTSYIV